MTTANNGRSISEDADAQGLGVSLGPTLRGVCDGKLGEINWFRTTWQHGGAATGFSTWTHPDGQTTEVVVKLPVNFQEWFWTARLGAVESDQAESEAALALPTPRVFAGGEQLAEYDLAWMVIERLGSPPLASNLTKPALLDLLRTAAEFHARTARIRDVRRAPRPGKEDWRAEIQKAREVCRGDRIDDAQRWNDLLRRVERQLDSLMARWRARPIDTWCHGDLHGHNAMRRRLREGQAGRCVLIDLALVHPGCWIEDALYLERLFWARRDHLHGVRVVQTLGRFRRELGLATVENASDLANVRRVLMAATAPAFLSTEGHPAHLAAALELLERLLPVVTR
jgi:hypothetical protein